MAKMRSTDFVRREDHSKRGFNIDPSTYSCAIMQRHNVDCEENTETGRNKMLKTACGIREHNPDQAGV